MEQSIQQRQGDLGDAVLNQTLPVVSLQIRQPTGGEGCILRLFALAAQEAGNPGLPLPAGADRQQVAVVAAPAPLEEDGQAEQGRGQQAQWTEGLLNHIEMAIRCFDPCLSCATHALGKMPLQVELQDAEGRPVDEMTRSA